MDIYREVISMVRCPACDEEIYWVIVRGKVFSIPFSLKDVDSEKAGYLKYNTIFAVYCPKCFQKLNIRDYQELIRFLK